MKTGKGNTSLYSKVELSERYLRQHLGTAQDYAALKRDLAARFRDDRVAYNDGKTAFVEAVQVKARG